MKLQITSQDALIVVDMQKDFMPGGALPVPKADEILPRVNRYVRTFEEHTRPIIFTRDWHPKNHLSFVSQGGLWPPHCVQNSEGAKFAEGLYMPKDFRFVISKGTSPDFDAYSGFEGTILHDLLKERGIRRVFVCGVATDYCVKNTALGALYLGYTTFVLEDAIQGVLPTTTQEAVEEMMQKGAIFMKIEDF